MLINFTTFYFSINFSILLTLVCLVFSFQGAFFLFLKDCILQNQTAKTIQPILHRKEVIQPHLPIRLPCYDFTPVTGFTFGGSFLTVRSPTSGASNSHGVTGGVYKARERIHRDMLIRDY